jgi:hypothetical protein
VIVENAAGGGQRGLAMRHGRPAVLALQPGQASTTVSSVSSFSCYPWPDVSLGRPGVRPDRRPPPSAAWPGAVN